MSQSLTQSRSVQFALDELVRLAAQICQTPFALIHLFEYNHQPVWMSVGLDLEAASKWEISAKVRENGGVLIISDTLAEPAYANYSAVTAPPQIRFCAGVALTASDGATLGTLCVLDQVPRQLDPSQIEALHSLGRQILTQLDLQRHVAQLEQALGELNGTRQELEVRANREALLHDITRIVRQFLDLDKIVESAIEQLRQHLHLSRCCFTRYTETEWIVTHCAAQSGCPSTQGVGGSLSWEENSIADQLLHGSLVIHNTQTDPKLKDWRSGAAKLNIKSLIFAPVYVDRQLFGIICCHQCDRLRQWQSDEVDLVNHVADQVAIAIQHAQMYCQVQQYSDRLEEQVQQRTQELASTLVLAETANQQKTEFLANVSHELRTPLTTILGFARLLHDQIHGDLNPKQMQYVNLIHTSGQHLLNLINDLLDLSKVEAGRMELDLQSVSPVELCERVICLMRERAIGKNISLTFENHLPDRLKTALLDDRKMYQILVNLVSNAVKFTPAKGQVILRLSLEKTSMLNFSVIDTGIGIPLREQGKVFEAFYQVDNSMQRRAGGTGLGLALCRQFVKLMNGSIYLKSQEKQGSTFTVQIPLHANPIASAGPVIGSIHQ
ncbi:hypothetical protein C7B76_14655 [filamentous cyanobacterium CCP2]|nr:hypothetical protein C7B76_14655 [filamentous cyanobacterium CCP2]